LSWANCVLHWMVHWSLGSRPWSPHGPSLMRAAAGPLERRYTLQPRIVRSAVVTVRNAVIVAVAVAVVAIAHAVVVAVAVVAVAIAIAGISVARPALDRDNLTRRPAGVGPRRREGRRRTDDVVVLRAMHPIVAVLAQEGTLRWRGGRPRVGIVRQTLSSDGTTRRLASLEKRNGQATLLCRPAARKSQ